MIQIDDKGTQTTEEELLFNEGQEVWVRAWGVGPDRHGIVFAACLIVTAAGDAVYAYEVDTDDGVSTLYGAGELTALASESASTANDPPAD
jgi:hypothetical protein